MRVLVVSQYFWPENFRINDLVEEFVRRGHSVTVLTGVPNYPDGRVYAEYGQDREKFLKYRGAEIVRVPMVPRGKNALTLILNYVSFACSASVVGACKLRNRTFDVIFVFEPSPITVGIPAAVLRSLKRAPLAFWVLDLWPETLHALGKVRSPRILKLVGKLVESIYKRCDLILAQSNSFIPQIRKYSASTKDIRYFPSWSETTFDMASALPAPEISSSPGTFNVMFAGNIGDSQDFPAILNAAEAIADSRVRWLIVGDGRAAAWLKSEIDRRKLNDKVILLGRYPLERMPSFFRHADALLVTLKDEPIFSMTIPGKVQSYLASGIPIIAMLNGEGARVIEESGAGLACPAGDYRALAKLVLRMSIMTAEERAAMGCKGIVASKREFDRTTLITRLEQWLTDIATKQSSTCPQGSRQ